MEDTEPSRLALASDLRWLINVGYVIEFNDASLDLPRGKSKPSQVLAAAEAGASSSNESGSEPFDWLWAKPALQLTWQRP
jgi:hypothetical protein